MLIIQAYTNKLNSRKTAVERQISCVINRTPTATTGTPQGILHFSRAQWYNGEASQWYNGEASQWYNGEASQCHSIDASAH